MKTADAQTSSGHASRPAEPFFKGEAERGFFASRDVDGEVLRKPAFESDEDVAEPAGEMLARKPASDGFLGGHIGGGRDGGGSTVGTGGGDGLSSGSFDVADVQLSASSGEAGRSVPSGATVLGDSATPFFAATAGRVQTRLEVNEPGDRYEREAEAMADRVTGPRDRIRALPPAEGPSAPNSADASTPALSSVQRRSDESPAVSSDLEGRLRTSKGKGRPLGSSTREEMEASFGADFREVRVHTGREAARMSNELGAEAFTHGGDIYFNENTYRPETTGGKQLLAHELTHTVQQGASVQKSPGRSQGPAEVEVQRVERAGGDRIQRGPLSSLINKILRYVPGWTLLTLIIGTNPVTGESVPRTPTNIIDAILGLIPGGVILADRLKETGALAEAGNWLSSEIDRLGITVSYIKDLISKAWDQLSIWNSWSTNLGIVKRIFGEPYRRIKAFAGRIATKIKEFIFRGALKLVGAPVGTIMSVLNKGREVLGLIFADPIGFMKNLGRAVGGGVKRFVANIKQHLVDGLISWLTGAMSGLPITLPAKWDLKGILHLVLQVLGLTWERIREKLVKRVGEKVVSAIEKGVEIVQRIRQEGPIALWSMIKEKAAEIKSQIMEGIRNWVITNVVKQAVVKLLSFINPAGALVQAVLGLYNLVMFLYENMSRIVEFVRSVFNSIGEIARGALGKAIEFVHDALGRTVPVILSFLARLIGLGNVGKAVTKVIKKIRKPVDRVVDKALDFVVKKGKALFKRAKSLAKKGVQKGKEFVGGLVDWLGFKKSFTDKNEETHKLSFKGKGKDATLMVASSTPQSVKKLLDEHPDKNSSARKDALAVYDKLYEKQSRLAELDEQATKGTRSKKEVTSDVKKLVADIRGDLNELAGHLAKLGITGKMAESVVSHIKPNSSSLPTKVEAEPLTAIAGNTKGQESSAAGDIPGWQYLRDIDAAMPEAKVLDNYVRFHLVHFQLHGPADESNLVAADKSSNSIYYNDMESTVIRKTYKAGNILWLHVNLNYHSNFPEFADRVTATWGYMKMDEKTGKPVKDENRSGGKASVKSDPPPDLTRAGPIPVRMRGMGEPNLRDVIGVSPSTARRVAKALRAVPGGDVYSAMETHYRAEGEERFLEGDRENVAEAIRKKEEEDGGKYEVKVGG